ncbi:MAG: sodium:calcium antiporter [Acidobacteriota bacterium]
MLAVALEFAVLGAIILVAGVRLSHYGDVIAEKSGLGRTWIGLILIATVTSIPELATGVSSVTLVGVPEIAVGDVLGSCMFNLVIIALMDLIGGRAPISTSAHPGQVVAGGFSIVLLVIVALSLLGGTSLPSFAGFGLYAPVILLVYAMAMRTIFQFEKRRIQEEEPGVPSDLYRSITMQKASVMFTIVAMVIVIAASFLPRVGARLAELSGLGETFVGSLFVAFSTSLPELVVSIAAVRMGAVDLAYGNLLGSNLFNVALIGLDDLLYVRGPILEVVSPAHGVAALIAAAMTAVVIIALTVRSGRRFFFLAWESIALVVLYLLGVAMLYAMRMPAERLSQAPHSVGRSSVHEPSTVSMEMSS